MSTFKKCIWGKNLNFGDTVCSIIDNIKFSDNDEENLLKRKIMYKRFVNEVDYYEKIASNITLQYNFLRIMITIGSMLLPTLQTIQGNKQITMYDSYIFWISIFVSLKIMICNGIISLFKIDQRYTLYNLTSEKLKKAGWNYLERTGRYTFTKNNEEADYSYNLILFFEEIEQIKEQTTIKEFGDETSHFIKKDKEQKKNIEQNNEQNIEQNNEQNIKQNIEQIFEKTIKNINEDEDEDEDEENKYYSPQIQSK